jgi:hypothetical protein
MTRFLFPRANSERSKSPQTMSLHIQIHCCEFLCFIASDVLYLAMEV